jgi:hypothetical protein
MTIQEQLTKALADLAASNAKLTSLETASAASATSLTEIHGKVSALEADKARLTADLATSSASVAALTTKITTLEATMNDKASRIAITAVGAAGAPALAAAPEAPPAEAQDFNALVSAAMVNGKSEPEATRMVIQRFPKVYDAHLKKLGVIKPDFAR